MANRRKFLAGIGALASGSAAAVGTGAFTSVSANRDVAVRVANDSGAYLALTATSAYAAQSAAGDSAELGLDFTGEYSGQRGSGLNTRAETEFEGVFEIKNQGTNDVYVWIATNNPTAGGAQSVEVVAGDEESVGTTASDGSAVDISLPSDVSGSQNITDNGPSSTGGGYIKLNPGDSTSVDLQFFVNDAGPQTWNKEWQINADTTPPADSDYTDTSLTGHPDL